MSQDARPLTESDNPHRVEVYIETGGGVDMEIVCDAPEGAPCRLWCDEGCESAGPDHGEIHELRDFGYCLRTEGWLDEPFDAYSGVRTELRSGPVLLEWEGDYYTWKYAGVKP